MTPKTRTWNFLNLRGGLADELIEICHKSRGLLLLIDDAHNLEDNEKQLLIDLVRSKEGTRLRRFTTDHRLLIVTIESQSTPWEGRPSGITRDLEVPSFTLVELRDIVRIQLTAANDADANEKIDSLLEQAQHNVNALFEHREKQLVEQLGQVFLPIESKGFEGRFGLAEMMAYWAIRQSRSVPKKDLVAWVESDELANHLAAFGVRRPSEPEKLVNNLIDSATLVKQTDKRTCYFDLQRCRALEQWLLQADGGRELLAQAHYFWVVSFSNKIAGPRIKPKEAEKLSLDNQHALKCGVWHAVQIGIILESARVVLTLASGLTDAERAERSSSVAASILIAAVLYRSQGNMREANNLIDDALEWLRGSTNPEASECVVFAADQLWFNYWLSGNVDIREKIGELANEFAGLNQEPFWRAYQRFEEILEGKEPLSPPLEEAFSSDPHLRNLDRLTQTLWDIRQSHGLMDLALRDVAVSIREPIEAPGNTMAEFQLRQIQAAAFNQRGSSEMLTWSLGVWRTRLEETKPTGGDLGSEVLHTYHKARYWHTLGEVWRLGEARLEESPDTDETAREGLFSRVRAAFLTPAPNDLPLVDQILRQAQFEYERAAQIAALLNWRSLIMEISFQLGALLHTYTPVEQRRIESAWWQRWDELFASSLDLERELLWIVNAPTIHLIRWKFFEDLAHEHSIEDAYNAFQAANRAHYPSELILDWHLQVSALLTNFGESDVDRQRDAELHEVWATDLAARPQAAKHWRFDCLEYEKASALLFSAQARRLLRQLDHVEQLLNKAQAFMEQVPANSTKKTEEGQKVRDLRISLSMQRAWLLHAQHRDNDYRRAILELWCSVRSEDEDCAILLSSLVNVEFEMNQLDESWLTKEAPHLDPENDGLSLPTEWFTESSLQLKNRFEFRFYQLLNLVNFSKKLQSGNIPLRSLMPSNTPQHLFTIGALQIVAACGWFGMNKFGETAMSLAKMGLQHGLSAETRALIINLLEAVRYYFAEIEPVDREELEALQVLMRYEPDSGTYRLAYVRVLNESKHLLKHKHLALESAETSWFEIAESVNDYLGVLVDATLLSNWVRAGLQRSGLSEDAFLNFQSKRRETLRQANAKLDIGDQVNCLGLLQSVLPVEPSPWIFLEDLRVLDLWLRCAKLQGLNGIQLEEVNKRARQLRKFALQYIRQFELVIREKEAQRLATDILNAIESR